MQLNLHGGGVKRQKIRVGVTWRKMAGRKMSEKVATKDMAKLAGSPMSSVKQRARSKPQPHRYIGVLSIISGEMYKHFLTFISSDITVTVTVTGASRRISI